MPGFYVRPTIVAALTLGLVAASVAPAVGQDEIDDRPAQVRDGFELSLVSSGIHFPTGIAIDGDSIWVSEAGIPPSPEPPRVLALTEGVAEPILVASELAAGMLAPPITGITFQDGWLYVSHRQMAENGWLAGAISRFEPGDPAATFETLVTDLPNSGDHHTNHVVFGEDGRMYFGIGSATNSGVVGLDSMKITGWLEKYPDFHDFPARDIALSGVEFETEDPLSEGSGTAITGPFMPFGSGEVEVGQTVRAPTLSEPRDGVVAGIGSVYSVDPTADDVESTLRLEAWGLRNPFGIGFDPSAPDRLLVVNNGADVRGVGGEANAQAEVMPIGSRPISNDFDDLFEVTVGDENVEFFGWPDFFHDPDSGEVLPVTDPSFCENPAAEITCPGFVLDDATHDRYEVLPATAQFADHSSADKLAFSSSDDFEGLFVALTGSFVPITGAIEFSGYKVVQVDAETYEISDFVVNPGKTAEAVFDPEGFNKPIDLKFRGDEMLILDFGVFEPGLGLMEPGTGKVWSVKRSAD